MSTITLCSEDESIPASVDVALVIVWTYSRLWNLENSPLSKRTWNACHTNGDAVNVLFTVSSPKENPVPMG